MPINPSAFLTTKRCGSCREVKPRKDFHKNKANTDGLGVCLECKRKSERQRYATDPEHRAKVKAKNRDWKRANRKRDYQLKRKHPQKYKARKAVQNAVYKGKIAKPDHCERCDEPTPRHLLQGHHHDYDKPLDMEWLCSSCHPR